MESFIRVNNSLIISFLFFNPSINVKIPTIFSDSFIFINNKIKNGQIFIFISSLFWNSFISLYNLKTFSFIYWSIIKGFSQINLSILSKTGEKFISRKLLSYISIKENIYLNFLFIMSLCSFMKVWINFFFQSLFCSLKNLTNWITKVSNSFSDFKSKKISFKSFSRFKGFNFKLIIFFKFPIFIKWDFTCSLIFICISICISWYSAGISTLNKCKFLFIVDRLQLNINELWIDCSKL